MSRVHEAALERRLRPDANGMGQDHEAVLMVFEDDQQGSMKGVPIWTLWPCFMVRRNRLA